MADVADPHRLAPAEGRVPHLHSATHEAILEGRTAPADLSLAAEILQETRPELEVACEVRVEHLPPSWDWALLCGIEEVLALLEGREIEVLAVPEGSVVYREEPVLQIAGRYAEFAELGTAVVGMLSHATGVATAAARLRLAAGGSHLYPIGLGGVHPSVMPVMERSAYVGGFEIVLSSEGADLTGADAVHLAGPELSVALGQSKAWEAFDAATPVSEPRLIVLGTLQDERSSALEAASLLGRRLSGVLIQGPSSDPARLVHVIREVRWELDARGRSDVRIIVAGDLTEEQVGALSRHVDGFAVGKALAGAPSTGFSFEVVEVEGESRSRLGALSGRKTLWRCEACGNRGIAPAGARHEPCPRCGGTLRGLMVRRSPGPGAGEQVDAIRARAARETKDAQV
jgi:nicotinate phosphoribosyltransferase